MLKLCFVCSLALALNRSQFQERSRRISCRYGAPAFTRNRRLEGKRSAAGLLTPPVCQRMAAHAPGVFVRFLPPFPILAAGTAADISCVPSSHWCVEPSCEARGVTRPSRDGRKNRCTSRDPTISSASYNRLYSSRALPTSPPPRRLVHHGALPGREGETAVSWRRNGA